MAGFVWICSSSHAGRGLESSRYASNTAFKTFEGQEGVDAMSGIGGLKTA